jgi:hypothetical protein
VNLQSAKAKSQLAKAKSHFAEENLQVAKGK